MTRGSSGDNSALGNAPSRVSGLGRAYIRLHAAFAGKHPRIRPWHFQWLATRALYAELRRTLPQLRGKVLDLGCGEQPYRDWMTSATEVTGIDVVTGPQVDLVVENGTALPFAAHSFDAILCTQVLEHVPDAEHFLAELVRVLRPGGTLLLSVPFCYNQHGAPFDFRRFTIAGLQTWLSQDFDVDDVRSQNRIGSTIATLFLNWLDEALDANRPLRLVKAVLLPLNLLCSLAVNGFAIALDCCDHTGAFYANVLCLCTRRGLPAPTRSGSILCAE